MLENYYECVIFSDGTQPASQAQLPTLESLAGAQLAGDFHNDIQVHGKINTATVSVKIDHPNDPANKYLNHSYVADMKNIYD